MQRHLVLAATLIFASGCGSTGVSDTAATPPAASTVAAARTDSGATEHVALKPGWNMVGLRLTDVTKVTGSEGVSALSWYDGQSFQVGPVSADTVRTAGSGKAFWVFSAQGGSLDYSGSPGATQEIQVKTGWNLISFAQDTKAGQLTRPEPVQPLFAEAAGSARLDLTGADATLTGGTGYWVYSYGQATLSRRGAGHTLRFGDLAANRLVNRPFALQVQAFKTDGSLDSASTAVVTLNPGGQQQALVGGTAIFPAVTLGTVGITRLTASDAEGTATSPDINVVAPPPTNPGE